MKMKILLVPALLVVSGASAIAQIKKGALFLGGQLSFKSSSIKSNDVNTGENVKSFSIMPAAGKAIRENLVLGADVSYQYSENGLVNPKITKSNLYGIGFFVRKYRQLGKGFYLFGQARAGGAYSTKEYTDYFPQQPFGTSLHGYDLQLGVYPGVAYAAGRRFQLEAGFNNVGYVNYSHSRATAGSNPAGSHSYDNFSLGSSLSDSGGFTVGFRVLLN